MYNRLYYQLWSINWTLLDEKNCLLLERPVYNLSVGFLTPPPHLFQNYIASTSIKIAKISALDSICTMVVPLVKKSVNSPYISEN